MTALAGRFVAALVGATSGVLVLAALANGGCGSSLPTPAQEIDLGYWTALDAKCLAQPTRALYDQCADANRVAACGAGGSYADAGVACANVRLSDGGKP